MTHVAIALDFETLQQEHCRRGPCILLAYVRVSVHADGRAKHTMTNSVLPLTDDNFVLDNAIAMTQKRQLQRRDIRLTRLMQNQQRHVEAKAEGQCNNPQRIGGIFLQPGMQCN